jgi:hypothetical protein
MPVHNEVVKVHNFLSEMYKDSYFPDFLVDKIKSILVDMCEQIESTNPSSDDELFRLTHAATERINELEEEFEENDIELETGARENIAENFDFLVKAYGYSDVDIEDVIAPREW